MNFKKCITVLLLLITTSVFAQLNQRSLTLKKASPEIFDAIRLVSYAIHDGDNSKVSTEINLQCAAYIDLVILDENLDYEILFTFMNKFCADSDKFVEYYNSGRSTECFSLPIVWTFVKEFYYEY
tara:strand:- start:81 stop:455 length:375 start_codon:yes stop_codon:yes gene_type:complete